MAGTVRDKDSGTERILAAVRALALPIVEGLGLELFDLQFRREQPGWVLRLVIDAENGISLDDCTMVSRELSDLLDVEEVIDRPFHLEVSSPGLDRPLRGERDFVRFAGRRAKVVCREPVAGQKALEGVLAGVREGALVLATGQGEVAIPLDCISRSRLVVEW
ncbi:MAG: ribosome maturation factor RimP [Thermodesulfobacteriota bacterium]